MGVHPVIVLSDTFTSTLALTKAGALFDRTHGGGAACEASAVGALCSRHLSGDTSARDT